MMSEDAPQLPTSSSGDKPLTEYLATAKHAPPRSSSHATFHTDGKDRGCGGTLLVILVLIVCIVVGVGLDRFFLNSPTVGSSSGTDKKASDDSQDIGQSSSTDDAPKSRPSSDPSTRSAPTPKEAVSDVLLESLDDYTKLIESMLSADNAFMRTTPKAVAIDVMAPGDAATQTYRSTVSKYKLELVKALQRRAADRVGGSLTRLQQAADNLEKSIGPGDSEVGPAPSPKSRTKADEDEDALRRDGAEMIQFLADAIMQAADVAAKGQPVNRISVLRARAIADELSKCSARLKPTGAGALSPIAPLDLHALVLGETQLKAFVDAKDFKLHARVVDSLSPGANVIEKDDTHTATVADLDGKLWKLVGDKYPRSATVDQQLIWLTLYYEELYQYVVAICIEEINGLALPSGSTTSTPPLPYPADADRDASIGMLSPTKFDNTLTNKGYKDPATCLERDSHVKDAQQQAQVYNDFLQSRHSIALTIRGTTLPEQLTRLPRASTAQADARKRLIAWHNLFNTAAGKVIIDPWSVIEGFETSLDRTQEQDAKRVERAKARADRANSGGQNSDYPVGPQ